MCVIFNVMKTIKFRPALAQLIIEGKKTTTWRLFDDKDLQTGDVVELMNSETKEIFGHAFITEVVEKPIKDLDDHDWEGHERFSSDEAMYAAYRTYYPGKEIGSDTLVKILHFARYAETAGGVVLNKRGEVAAVNQHGNSWSFPKGKIEQGEDALTAAKREIYEETGIRNLRLIKELGSYERYSIGQGGIGEDKTWFGKRTLFLFETDEERLQPIDPENPEARWVKKEDVAGLLTHPKDKEFFIGLHW